MGPRAQDLWVLTRAWSGGTITTGSLHPGPPCTAPGAHANMNANQRRTGLRLPWLSDEPAPAAPATESAPPGAGEDEAPTVDSSGADELTVAGPTPAPDTEADALPQAPVTDGNSDAEPPAAFMRELVSAMRRVADEAKRAGIADARSRADDHIKQLDAEAERRHAEFNSRAETDIAGVGEWAMTEAERIKAEAERRVAARRAELEEQLVADRARGETESKAVRARVSDYERELDAFHAQLAEVTDPAAFAAAAKRMPRPPILDDGTPDLPAASDAKPVAAADVQSAMPPASTNGVQAAAERIHPAEEEVLAARLAELDAELDGEVAEPTSAPTLAAADPESTEVVVTGLGSFGAITSFRQALSDIDGVEAVALSLGSSGEFIFRASHRPGYDMRIAIGAVEGHAAKIETRAEGGLLVKLTRAT